MANFKGDNVNNKFWKTKCGNGQAWYGACGRGDYCGSSYGKNVGAIETHFDGMTTMICFFKVPTYTYYSDKDKLILSSGIIEKSIISSRK